MSFSSQHPMEKQEKKYKKKRKREAEQQPAVADDEGDERGPKKKKHMKKKKQKKEKKVHKKDKKGRRSEEADESSASPMDVQSAPPEDAAAASERKQKREKKAAKRARDAEVLAAGERALQEEQAEADAEAAEIAQRSLDEKKKKKKHKKKKGGKKEKEASTDADAETTSKKKQRKREKKERKAREAEASSSEAAATTTPAVAPSSSSCSSSTTAAADPAAPKVWPAPPPGNVTLLLFYQYVRPSWTPSASRNAENFARDSLTKHGCTGRLRCAREGFNGTLTGSASGIRAFCEDLRAFEPAHFGTTDFKLVDGLRDSQRLKGLKVWHVEELVTYGFGPATAERGVAPLEAGGTHLPPAEWHAKAAEPDTVLIDVRNANENAIGRFQPLGDPSRVLDPNMRTSTEFPAWVDEVFPKLQQAKQVMMYCTGGIRCERASALLVQKGLDASKVFQLEGGIHRYLEAFPTGGHWIGKNYTFDRRFAHGAVDAPPEAQVAVGRCCLCTAPWDRYQAHKKCALCRMEVLLCRECERGNKFKGQTLKCHLCGGPKPSYLPEGDKTIKFKQSKFRGFPAKSEGDY